MPVRGMGLHQATERMFSILLRILLYLHSKTMHSSDL